VNRLRNATLLLLLPVLTGALPPARLRAQRHPPEVRALYPPGGRPGMTTRVTVSGVSLRDASQILFDRPGVTAKIVGMNPASPPAPTPASDGPELLPHRAGAEGAPVVPTPESDGNPDLVVEFSVAKDATPAVYDFRIVAAAGLSNVGRWVVGRDLPDVEEKEPNNSAAQAQVVALPAAINGRIGEVGDQDCFAFDLKAGQTFVAEVSAAAAGSPLDSLLTLRDADGRTLASNDDADGPDSRLVFPVPKSGRYVLTLSDSVGGGGSEYVYRLSVGYLPYVAAVYPASVEGGKTTQITPVGINLPPSLTQTWPPAGSAPGEAVRFSTPNGPTNPHAVFLAALPTIQEQEPNDDRAHATPMPAPGIANGRFTRADGKPGPDVDYFKFTVKSGRRLVFDAQCQAIGTPGDPLLTLYDGDGKQLDENTGSGSRDAHLDRMFEKSGDYYLRVRDAQNRSAPELVYRLVIQDSPPPGFTLTTETRARAVGRGDSVPFEVNIERDRWDGPVTLSIADLPPGVTASTAVVPSGVNGGLLVLTADKTAPLGPFPLRIVGEGQVYTQKVRRVLDRASDWIWKGGDRTTAPVPPGLLQFAVTGTFEVAPRSDTKTLAVARGQSVKFKIGLEKRAPYNRAVTLRALGLPDGVEMSDVSLPPDKTEAELEIKAGAEARLGTFPITISSVVSSSQAPNVQLDRVLPAIALTVREAPKK
jgi:hypothetical protein